MRRLRRRPDVRRLRVRTSQAATVARSRVGRAERGRRRQGNGVVDDVIGVCQSSAAAGDCLLRRLRDGAVRQVPVCGWSQHGHLRSLLQP